MSQREQADWDPMSEAVLREPYTAQDDMRRRCPVAYSEAFGWSLFRHEDVLRVLLDHHTFSNVVSAHRSVPSGMDPPEHTAYRRALEPYFLPERMLAFEAPCRQIARGLLETLARGQAVDAALAFATPYAARCQCAFLGWPEKHADALVSWTHRNHQAVLASDRAGLEALAREFHAHVVELLEARRGSGEPTGDVTSSLLQARVDGALLSDDELVSVLRNWTVGEVGSLASAIGILLYELAAVPALQQRLREQPALLPAAIDEITRISGPLVLNRRRALRAVEIGGRQIAAGERLALHWIAANRDERVFQAPLEVELQRDQSQSLLYGAGIHVCPGAPLARLELRIALEELFQQTRWLELERGAEPRRALYPAAGWASLPVRLA